MILTSHGGAELTGRLMRDSMVTPVFTVLNVLPQGKGKVRSVIIFPDSMSRERSRELRMILKWDSDLMM